MVLTVARRHFGPAYRGPVYRCPTYYGPAYYGSIPESFFMVAAEAVAQSLDAHDLAVRPLPAPISLATRTGLARPLAAPRSLTSP